MYNFFAGLLVQRAVGMYCIRWLYWNAKNETSVLSLESNNMLGNLDFFCIAEISNNNG